MGIDGRLTLSCSSLELGAKCAPFEPDEKCMKYVAATPNGKEPMWPTRADPDAVYEKVYTEDFSDLEPQVALPHGFDVVKPVSEVKGVKVDQVNMGSCANGRYDDMEITARILKGRKLKSRLIFAPGSWKIIRRAIASGVMATILDAGGMVDSPTCGPCDARTACIGDGEIAVGCTTRNFRGRYGSKDSQVYLASPATCAASAVMGELTDPRELL
jgi:3-isopropylmalate/(R)-2-methylmalate dehydratase large subunit